MEKNKQDDNRESVMSIEFSRLRETVNQQEIKIARIQAEITSMKINYAKVTHVELSDKLIIGEIRRLCDILLPNYFHR